MSRPAVYFGYLFHVESEADDRVPHYRNDIPAGLRSTIMDPQNLQTASEYVNNLLLSRGLLRNGMPIEFAKPSKAEGGANATMAQIINLVHDMVLRRDVRLLVISSIHACAD